MPELHAAPTHQDPGLQPERTVLSWGRTAIALFAAALIFLRWLPHYGAWILTLIGLASITSISIYATQRGRYSVRVTGLAAQRIPADVAAILWTGCSVVLLGILGMIVLFTG